MLIERLVWPHGKVCAAMLSVNLDAEFFGRIYYPDVDVDSGDILSLGRTGMNFGMHLIRPASKRPSLFPARWRGAIPNRWRKLPRAVTKSAATATSMRILPISAPKSSVACFHMQRKRLLWQPAMSRSASVCPRAKSPKKRFISSRNLDLSIPALCATMMFLMSAQGRN